MTYKRTDIAEDAQYDGFCFVDADELEIAVDTRAVDRGSRVVSIYADDRAQFDVYWSDIPKFIKMLEDTYEYCKGQQ